MPQSLPRRALAQSAGWLLAAGLAPVAAAKAQTPPGDDTVTRIQKLIPELEAYTQAGMKSFDVPGASLGIIAGDRLLYANGFGLCRKGSTDPVTMETVFQIGSTTKAFLATVLAIAVDRGKLKWDDRVADLEPSFALKDPYVTREFRVFDLLAQRSGLTPYANDLLSSFGYDSSWLMHSLRFAEPVSSFRSSFAYTNITHMFAGRIAAQTLDAPDWPALAEREIVRPLGMRDVSFTAEAIAAAPNHATGHRWTPDGSVEIPFTPVYPYLFGPAGDINANVQDCLRWLRLQLGNGMFEGRRLVSSENLSATRTPKVALNDVTTYAMGWIISELPNGRAIWHNGGTNGFGAHIGFLPTHNLGLVILSNQENKGFPDALAMWIYNRIAGDPSADPMPTTHAHTEKQAAEKAKRFQRPAATRPPPDLPALAGDYHAAVFGSTTVNQDNGALIMALKKTGARIRLEPFNGAVFTASLFGEGRFADLVSSGIVESPFGFVNFQAEDSGRLTRFTLSAENQTFLFACA